MIGSLDSKVPEGPRREVDEPQVRHEVGQPGQQAQVRDHHRRHRSRRCVGGGHPRRARLQGEGLHLSTTVPRRAHSIAAQGGINGAKNYQNDGDSVYRLFYDTIKGGDYRSREANVHRLAEVSVNIIDQCVAQGVPFAREYGGMLDNRSFGGAQVSRTFYARGQTGQQLLLGAYSALMRQVALGNVELTPTPRCST
jgi:succinate dehydrogenase / fumarate reductase, flavoprotein subunit